ncbi:MAG: hypothetical protein IJN43_18875 [Ruminococcus sp.]|nr:hypothetical protein [Ruminococcus sp.]
MKNDITLTAGQIFGTETVILTAQTEQYEYEGNKRTDKFIANRFTVVSPARNFQTFNVKVENGKLLKVSDDEIADACEAMKPIWVRFIGFRAKAYATDAKKVAYSCSAEGVEIVDENELDLFGGES